MFRSVIALTANHQDNELSSPVCHVVIKCTWPSSDYNSVARFGVLQNPEAIIDFVRRGDNWNGLQYCANRVYNQKTGDVLMPPFWKKTEDDQPGPDEDDALNLWNSPKDKPFGKKWNEADLPAMFPTIAQAITKSRLGTE